MCCWKAEAFPPFTLNQRNGFLPQCNLSGQIAPAPPALFTSAPDGIPNLPEITGLTARIALSPSLRSETRIQYILQCFCISAYSNHASHAICIRERSHCPAIRYEESSGHQSEG